MTNEPDQHDKDTQQTLRTGIRQTYARYQIQDRDRFPAIDYNTSRANYEPLRISFEHELFVVRGIRPDNPSVHLPSTNTLALLFTDDHYTPGPKILTACRLYAENLPVTALVTEQATHPVRTFVIHRRWLLALLFAGLLTTGSFLLYQSTRTSRKQAPGKLSIHYPKPGQVVPRLLRVAGRFEQAKGENVWLIVRPVTVPTECYVQFPTLVKADGSWDTYVFIGTNNDLSVGCSFDIRAFAGLDDAYTIMQDSTDYIHDSWPEHAVRSTEAIRVIRGKARY